MTNASPLLTLKLDTGHEMPAIGLGCYFGGPTKTADDQGTYDMVMQGLKIGCHHIDTAFRYNNEKAVGRAIRESGLARSEIFVTTKLWNGHHGNVEFGFKESLKALDVDYIDLYLMHWPLAQDSKDGAYLSYDQSPTFVETWKEMEKLLQGGKVRSIGVSNFSVKNLEILLAQSAVVPAVNQVESHPFLPQASLSEYCESKGIVMTAYCPLGQPRGNELSPILKDPLVRKLAVKYGKPEGTIILSWTVQRGNWAVIPKSTNLERQRANLSVITLDQTDHDAMSALHKEPGKLAQLCNYKQGDWRHDGKLFGWTLEQLGWEELD